MKLITVNIACSSKSPRYFYLVPRYKVSHNTDFAIRWTVFIKAPASPLLHFIKTSTNPASHIILVSNFSFDVEKPGSAVLDYDSTSFRDLHQG
jgi:hypothetical protein